MGSQGTPKTEIIRFVSDMSKVERQLERGAAVVSSKQVELALPSRAESVKLKLWDTSGKEESLQLQSDLVSQESVILLVIKLSDEQSISYVDNLSIDTRGRKFALMILGEQSLQERYASRIEVITARFSIHSMIAIFQKYINNISIFMQHSYT